MTSRDGLAMFSTKRISWSIVLLVGSLVHNFGCSLSDEGSHAKGPTDAQHSMECALDSRSFELISLVRNDNLGLEFRLEESYSASQERGMVKMAVLGAGPGAKSKKQDLSGILKSEQTFFVDTKEGISIRRIENSGTCERVDRLQLMSTLEYKDLIPAEDLLSKGPRTEHVIGPARLLYHFCRKRSELRAEVASGTSYPVRNVLSASFRGTYLSVSGKTIEANVFYSETSLVPENRALAIPNSIQFFLDNKIAPTIYFTALKFVPEEDGLNLKPTNLANLQMVQLDKFVIEPASGCSLALDYKNRRPLFFANEKVSGEERKRHFSFRAQIEHSTIASGGINAKYEAQVACDERLAKMRIDWYTPEMPVMGAVHLFDLLNGRATHVIPSGMLSNPSKSVADLLPTQDASGPPKGMLKRCTRTRMPSVPSLPIDLLADSPTYMLLGSGSFAYLGLARVRSIKARVYEEVDSDLPLWLNYNFDKTALGLSGDNRFVTLAYIADDSEWAPGLGGDHSHSTSDESKRRPLLIEVYEMDSRLEAVLGKRAISIFDFSWSLQAIRAGRPSDKQIKNMGLSEDDSLALSMFSLADLCSQGNELVATSSQSEGALLEQPEPRGRFEMVLETGAPIDRSLAFWLNTNARERNLAFLGALQKDMHLDASMTYDLETRLVDWPRGAKEPFQSKSSEDRDDEDNQGSMRAEDEKRNIQLVANFNIARIVPEVSWFQFLGFGSSIQDATWMVRTISFLHCFTLAAHHKLEIEFAYSFSHGTCFMGARPLADNVIKSAPSFVIDINGPLRVFKITRTMADEQKISLEYWAMEDAESNKFSPYRNTKLTLRRSTALGASGRGTDVEFLVKRLQVHVHKPHAFACNSKTSNNDEHNGERANFLPGLGLGLGSDLSWSVEDTAQASKSYNAEFSLADCRALCDADSDCKAVSYCLRGARADCFLSSADLGSPHVLSAIKSQAASSMAAPPRERQFKVELNIEGANKQVELVRDQNCAIYSKQYLEMFSPSTFTLIGPSNIESLRAAVDAEQCASLCFKQSLDLLRGHHAKLSSLFEQFDGALLEGASGKIEVKEQGFSFDERLQQAHENFTNKACYKFYFISNLQLQTLSDEARALLDALAGGGASSKVPEQMSAADTGLQGYCAFASQKITPVLKESSGKKLDIPSESYILKLSSFYDEQRGIRLRQSKLSESEQEAVSKIQRSSKNLAPSKESIEIVSRLLTEGVNFQTQIINIQKDYCAALCFKQSSGLWPLCRSFDLVIMRTSNASTARVKCVLNSASKREGSGFDTSGHRRQDLIETASQAAEARRKLGDGMYLEVEEEDFWHYELKEGLLTTETVEREWLFAKVNSRFQRLGAGSFYFDRFGVRIVVGIVSLGFGLLLAALVSEQLKSRDLWAIRSTEARNRASSCSSTMMLDEVKSTH